MRDAIRRLRTLRLIVQTLSRVNDDPALRLAEIRGLLFGEANRDPELATLVQSLPPIEAEAEAANARLRRDRDIANDVGDVQAELPALRTDVEAVLAENTRLQQALETAQADAQRWQGFAERLMSSKDDVEARLGFHGEPSGALPQFQRLRTVLSAIVDVNDDRFINEGGTCNWCGKDALEDVDTDELDEEEIEALPKHEEDCPIVKARALLAKEAT